MTDYRTHPPFTAHPSSNIPMAAIQLPAERTTLKNSTQKTHMHNRL